MLSQLQWKTKTKMIYHLFAHHGQQQHSTCTPPLPPCGTVRDTIIHSIHSLFSEWILWTWQLRRLLFNINHGWPDRRAVTTPWPSAVSFNARPPAWQQKNISTTSPTEKNLMSYSPLRPASFWKLLNHFFSSCPCDILLYIVSGGWGGAFSVIAVRNMKV